MAEALYSFSGCFSLTLDDLAVGEWREVSGLSAQIEVEELKEGGENGFVHKLPGRVKWPNLVFKKGAADTDTLFKWFDRHTLAASKGKVHRSTGAVCLMRGSEVVRRWEFEGAFPVRWSGPTLAATSRDVAGEELEIAHNGFKSSAS